MTPSIYDLSLHITILNSQMSLYTSPRLETQLETAMEFKEPKTFIAPQNKITRETTQ